MIPSIAGFASLSGGAGGLGWTQWAPIIARRCLSVIANGKACHACTFLTMTGLGRGAAVGIVQQRALLPATAHVPSMLGRHHMNTMPAGEAVTLPGSADDAVLLRLPQRPYGATAELPESVEPLVKGEPWWRQRCM